MDDGVGHRGGGNGGIVGDMVLESHTGKNLLCCHDAMKE